MTALKKQREASLARGHPVPLANTLVAQYVRMSTKDQQYSIANQKAKIEEYAVRHPFIICRTYAGAGPRRGEIGKLLITELFLAP